MFESRRRDVGLAFAGAFAFSLARGIYYSPMAYWVADLLLAMTLATVVAGIVLAAHLAHEWYTEGEVDSYMAAGFACLTLVFLAYAWVNAQGPYLVLECAREQGSITYHATSSEGMPRLSTETLKAHCQQKLDSVHPSVYDLRQNIEYVIWGETKP